MVASRGSDTARRRGTLVTAMISPALRLMKDKVRPSEKGGAESSVRARITRAAVTTGFFSVVVKLVSLASTLLIASLFGTGDDLEAYFIAFLVPSFLFQVVSGSFSSAMIPTYVQVTEQQGPIQAQALFSRVMVLAHWDIVLGVYCVGVCISVRPSTARYGLFAE